jgi:hypothetical protein
VMSTERGSCEPLMTTRTVSSEEKPSNSALCGRVRMAGRGGGRMKGVSFRGFGGGGGSSVFALTKRKKTSDSLGELLLDLGGLLLGLFHVLHEASEVGERVAAAALLCGMNEGLGLD